MTNKTYCRISAEDDVEIYGPDGNIILVLRCKKVISASEMNAVSDLGSLRIVVHRLSEGEKISLEDVIPALRKLMEEHRSVYFSSLLHDGEYKSITYTLKKLDKTILTGILNRSKKLGLTIPKFIEIMDSQDTKVYDLNLGTRERVKRFRESFSQTQKQD